MERHEAKTRTPRQKIGEGVAESRTYRNPSPPIIPQHIMKINTAGITSAILGLVAAASMMVGFDPWIGALLAISAGLAGLRAGLTGRKE